MKRPIPLFAMIALVPSPLFGQWEVTVHEREPPAVTVVIEALKGGDDRARLLVGLVAARISDGDPVWSDQRVDSLLAAIPDITGDVRGRQWDRSIAAGILMVLDAKTPEGQSVGKLKDFQHFMEGAGDLVPTEDVVRMIGDADSSREAVTYLSRLAVENADRSAAADYPDFFADRIAEVALTAMAKSTPGRAELARLERAGLLRSLLTRRHLDRLKENGFRPLPRTGGPRGETNHSGKDDRYQN